MSQEDTSQAARDAARNFVMDDATREKLDHLMRTTNGVLSLMSAFAAPRYLAQADQTKPPTRSQLVGLFNDFLEILGAPGSSPPKIEETTRRMLTLLETWEWSLQAPEPIVQTARDFLGALGIPEPDEGWDHWAGPSDEERNRAE